MIDWSKIPALDVTELRGGYMDEMAERLGKELAAKKDAIVSEAITVHLRTEKWKLAELAGRMTRVVDERDRSETYTLDGIGLVKFYPCALENKSTINENHVVAAFNYAILVKDPRSITSRMIEKLHRFRSEVCGGPARFELAGADWFEFLDAMRRDGGVKTASLRPHYEFYGCPVHRIVGSSGIRVRSN